MSGRSLASGLLVSSAVPGPLLEPMMAYTCKRMIFLPAGGDMGLQLFVVTKSQTLAFDIRTTEKVRYCPARSLLPPLHYLHVHRTVSSVLCSPFWMRWVPMLAARP